MNKHYQQWKLNCAGEQCCTYCRSQLNFWCMYPPVIIANAKECKFKEMQC